MAKTKKKINESQLRREFKRINQRLFFLNSSINYLINLILQERMEEASAEGDTPGELGKKVHSKNIKCPSNSYMG